jgi:molybdopterin-biosynthesis enzyme MoeA-like protein
MAVKAMAEKLGVADTVEAVAKAVQEDPQAAQKLAEINLKEFELHNANTDSARKMNAEIQNSSSASWLAKNIAYVIDCVIVVATLLLSWFAFIKGVPPENKELVYMALGSLLTMCGTVLNFHRGSSQGSKDKNDAMKGLK